MKVAVISDIHANFIALEAIVKDIKKENCDKVFCLGDIVLAGPQPRMTIDFVKAQDWTVIQGNTDKLIAEFNLDVLSMLQDKYPIMANAIVDDLVYVEKERLDYLSSLSPQLELVIEGVKVLLVHGSPRFNNEDISPGMPIMEVEKIIKDTDADLILCGHTHIPCGYQTNKKQTVINVGSVGRPMTSNAMPCYAIVDFDDQKFSVRHKFVDYDRETASEIIRKRGFEGAEKLAELLIKPVSRHG